MRENWAVGNRIDSLQFAARDEVVLGSIVVESAKRNDRQNEERRGHSNQNNGRTDRHQAANKRAQSSRQSCVDCFLILFKKINKINRTNKIKK